MALIGAFAASKLITAIMTVIGKIGDIVAVIRPLISILMNGGGLGAAISYIVGLLGVLLRWQLLRLLL